MEPLVVTSLREWAPLADILEKIPARTQKGIFYSDLLNLTCVDAIPEFIALGTDGGTIFWHNRNDDEELQKLRSEVSSPITSVKVCSSVEYMVAAGSANGQVNVFQIQKEHPADLNLSAPLTKSKPIQRYTIRDLHKGPVTCCEWSKNGMKLFSGDKTGVVVLTEFDYQTHLSKSIEILNEAYEIVQLSLHQSYLVVSTIYRSIVCHRDPKDGRWVVSQIGKKDRKILSEFGATFSNRSTKNPAILCSRPGVRFWVANTEGMVHQTLLFKDAIASKPCWEIPLLNPGKTIPKVPINFGRIFMYSENYAVTYNETALYILNLESIQVEAIARNFRKILNVSICDNEIFVLEGTRSLIRLAPSPEPPTKTAKIIFNPSMPPPLPSAPVVSMFDSPIEYEPEVINAEECFELPPIQHIDLAIPIQIDLDSPTTQTNKIIMEQNRRIQIFDRISDIQFDDSIIFKRGKKHKKDSTTGGSSKKKSKKKDIAGIVEIGQAISETVENLSDIGSNVSATSSPAKIGQDNTDGLTTKAMGMDASFCTNNSYVPEILTPGTKQKMREEKEKIFAEIEPIKLERIPDEQLAKLQTDNQFPTWQPASLMYPTLNFDDAQVQTTPRKKIHFISDDDDLSPKPDDFNVKGLANLCNDMQSVMIKSDCTSSTSGHGDATDKDGKMTKSLQFVSFQIEKTPQMPELPEIQQLPANFNIPSLWSMPTERAEESDKSDSQNSNEWEIV